MFKFIKELLVCPECHGELYWDNIIENDMHIIEAGIRCNSCSKSYFVKDSVGCFLNDKDWENENWQKGDDYLLKYFNAHPDIKDTLMNTPIEDLNAADLHTRADILRKEENEAEADRLGKLGYEKAYTLESRNALPSQINYVIDELRNKNGYIVDIAPGMCRLVTELLKSTELLVTATDISFNVMKKSHFN